MRGGFCHSPFVAASNVGLQGLPEKSSACRVRFYPAGQGRVERLAQRLVFIAARYHITVDMISGVS